MGSSKRKVRKRRHRSPSTSDSSQDDLQSPEKRSRKVSRRHSSSSSKKTIKRHRATSSSSDSSSDCSSSLQSSSSDSDSHGRRKCKKSRKKDKKSKYIKKAKKKKTKKHKKAKTKSIYIEVTKPVIPVANPIGPQIPIASSSTKESKEPARVLKPMTKEEWDKQQSILRHEYDPESGRTRLIRGDGEIMEEIVSKDRHKEINKQSTMGDGLFYQMQAGLHK